MMQQSFFMRTVCFDNSLTIAKVLTFRRSLHFTSLQSANYQHLSLGATKIKRKTPPQRNQDAPWKKKFIIRKGVLSPSKIMDPDVTDWGSFYDAASSYNDRVIPLNIRMGRPRITRIGDVPPKAFGNIEVLKIPNFFHLTPPAIKKHCDALREYCTPWPKDIGYRPVRVTTINHVFAGASIRFPEARFVKIQVHLKDLKLDDHAHRKFVLMVGDRYNPNTGELTLVVEKCPTRKQNKEYGFYLLSALYHEANKVESWESEADTVPTEFIDRAVEKVRKELYPTYYRDVKSKSKHTFYRVINDKLVTFNEAGHPFLFHIRKNGVTGLLSEEEIRKGREEWKKIQLDIPDTSTFDLHHDKCTGGKTFAGFEKQYANGKSRKFTQNVG